MPEPTDKPTDKPTDDPTELAGTPALSGPLRAVRRHVEHRLDQVLLECRHRWEDLGPSGRQMIDAAALALRGGKRVRALLGAAGLGLLTPCEARPQVLTSPQAVHLGAALELYQASALVHDDVMDGALTRRGLPAAHKVFAHAHVQHGWRGREDDFGASGAILLGDLLLSLAAEEAGRVTPLPPPPVPGRAGAPSVSQSTAATQAGPATGAGEDGPCAALRRARAAFDAMTTEVALGQFLDVRSEVLPLPQGEDPASASARMHADALAVVRHKSARYSVCHPLVIGALLAGAPPGCGTTSLLSLLETFGEEIGIAFQLRDDDLGVYGDPTLTGKPTGDDLREGKRTVLLALAWGRTDEAGRHLLAQVLANRQASREDIAEAARTMEACGARAAHEEQIQAHRRAGYQALEQLGRQPGLCPAGLEDLRALAVALTDRSS